MAWIHVETGKHLTDIPFLNRQRPGFVFKFYFNLPYAVWSFLKKIYHNFFFFFFELYKFHKFKVSIFMCAITSMLAILFLALT